MLKQSGTTLVELVMALGVSVILLGIAIPSYAFLVNSSRLAAVTNDLVTALQLARSESIKRGKRVSVCKSSTVMNESPNCSSAAQWKQGWIVFVDEGAKGVLDGEDKLLRVFDGAQSVEITASNFNLYGSYLPNGRSQGATGLATDTIHLCIAGNKRKIIINNTGRIRLENDTC